MKEPSNKEKELEKKLSPAQKNFVLAYLKHGNGTKAAKEAGYSPRSAHAQASALLRNPKIAEYMDEVRERIESEKIADIDEVMEYYTRVMRGEEKEQFDLPVAIADKTNAAKELLKRLTNINISNAQIVQIINNIPKPEQIEVQEDAD